MAFRTLYAPVFAILAVPSFASPEAPSIQVVPIKIQAEIDHPKVGNNDLKVTLSRQDGVKLLGLQVTLTVEMTGMDMGSSHPAVVDNGDGTYSAKLNLGMSGGWKVTVHVVSPGMTPNTQTFTFNTGDGAMGAMKGKLGDWGMQREGSGTSWLPDDSPMFMTALPKSGNYDLSLMGSFSLDYSSTNGPRGDHRFFSSSMAMLMATRDTGGGTLSYNLMVSLDPIFDGEYGYPDLFQTGETAYGKALVDYQHPHNLLSELTASYAHPIGGGYNAFLYGGPIGEPALGGPMFMHRPSGMEIPEAPITHHWFDSTHISSGVITAGVNDSHWQLDGSVFNGHEPGENRYVPDPVELNSTSARVTYNPSKQLSLSTSYGFLESPEATAPGVDQHRATASAIWSLPLPHGNNLSTTALYGRIVEAGTSSDAYVLESTYFTGPNSFFLRWENVAKDELVGIPPGDYRINKLSLGLVRNFASKGGFDFGVGGFTDLYSYPSSLDPYYGHGPVTLGVFFTVHPSRMAP